MTASVEMPETYEIPRFEFMRDSFAFANELIWEYRFDPASGKTNFARREPKPDYAHRCFVLTRAARQFLYHARFDPTAPPASEALYSERVRAIVRSDPRVPCAPKDRIVIPGHANLREFSTRHERLLKAECGGAWRSYFLRSHWRMIFPCSRIHQEATAGGLWHGIRQGGAPLIHLLLFPQLTINHGMILFEANEHPEGMSFAAYDPNQPARPAELIYSYNTKSFSLAANQYWAGGRLNIIEIFHRWWM
jgi:hypothetical protein